MGCSPFRVSSSRSTVESAFELIKEKLSIAETALSKNPNPLKFIVRQCEAIGKLYVSIVNYPNCTNYEGNKILVTDYDPTRLKKLDPHFSKHKGLIARFVPTEEGWKMAITFARMVELLEKQT